MIVRYNKKYFYYAWRDDDFGNKGWHLPGGIVRPNEKIMSRLEQVLIDEVDLINQIPSDPQFMYVGFSEVLRSKYPCVRSHFFLSYLFN